MDTSNSIEELKKWSRGIERKDTLPRGVKFSLRSKAWRAYLKHNLETARDEHLSLDDAMDACKGAFYEYMLSRQYFEVPEHVYEALSALDAITAEHQGKYYWMGRLPFDPELNHFSGLLYKAYTLCKESRECMKS